MNAKRPYTGKTKYVLDIRVVPDIKKKHGYIQVSHHINVYD